MKNSILNFFAAMMLVVSGVAMADNPPAPTGDCNTQMAQANDPGKSYNYVACQCVWQVSLQGCQHDEGSTSPFCNPPVLYHSLSTMTSNMAGANCARDSARGSSDWTNCVNELNYFSAMVAPYHACPAPPYTS